MPAFPCAKRRLVSRARGSVEPHGLNLLRRSSFGCEGRTAVVPPFRSVDLLPHSGIGLMPCHVRSSALCSNRRGAMEDLSPPRQSGPSM